jgi:hypothetical protein
LFAVLFEESSLSLYLETLTAWIAASCARANRASMGANITLPPRRRLTSIPAIAGRMLATPWAWGRISVTVVLAITGIDKATHVPARHGQENQQLVSGLARHAARQVTRRVS